MMWSKENMSRLKRPEGMIMLKQQKVVSQNSGATIRDMGDGVACLEFHTKMNALDDDIMNMAVKRLTGSKAISMDS